MTSGVLRNGRFRLLVAGVSVSEFGSAMFPVALVALVTAQHGAAMLGLLLAVRGISASVAGLAAGVLVGRMRKTTALVVNDIAQVVVTLGFATGTQSTPVLVALAMASGVFGSVVAPAGGSLLPLLVPADDLRQANAVKGIAHRVAAIGGPAVAGILVVTTSVSTVFLVDAATFVFSMLTLLLLREPKPADGPRESGFSGNLRLGFAEVIKRPWVVAIIAMATVQAPLMVAPGFTLLPIVAADHYTETVYGLALSCMAIGELVGGVLAAKWAPRRPGVVSIVGVLPYPLVLLALAALAPAGVILLGYVLVGMGFMMFGVHWYTALQKEIPGDTLGVVLSIDQVGSFGLEPVGYAVAGVVAEQVGARPVLVAAGAIGLVSTLVPLAVPGVARLSDSPPRREAPQPVGGAS